MSFPVSSSRPWPLTDISCSNMPREISFPQSSASSRVAKNGMKPSNEIRWIIRPYAHLLCVVYRVESSAVLFLSINNRIIVMRPSALNPSKDANHWNDFPQRRLSRQLWTQLATAVWVWGWKKNVSIAVTLCVNGAQMTVKFISICGWLYRMDFQWKGREGRNYSTTYYNYYYYSCW